MTHILPPLLRLLRFELPFTAGVCAVLGGILAAGTLPGGREMALGFLAIFCVSAAALILNDVFDVETDRINAPGRPIPSGSVTVRQAVGLFAVVSGAGLAAGAMLGTAAALSLVLLWSVGVFYNWRGKRYGVAGNLMVSFSVGMTFVFGGIVVGRPASIFAWWFGGIAMLMNLGEEIAADAMDVEGDRIMGSRSLAVVYGPERALRVSALIFVAMALFSLVPFFTGLLPPVYLLPIAIMDAVTTYCAMRLLNPGSANPRVLIRVIYLSGLVAVLIFIGLRLIL
jgi:geranylgeranylglycerol-phosphate geranylgeranyltransferase